LTCGLEYRNDDFLRRFAAAGGRRLADAGRLDADRRARRRFLDIKNDLELFLCSYFNINLNGIQVLDTRLGPYVYCTTHLY
jgi:hypothetical protein